MREKDRDMEKEGEEKRRNTLFFVVREMNLN